MDALGKTLGCLGRKQIDAVGHKTDAQLLPNRRSVGVESTLSCDQTEALLGSGRSSVGSQ